MFFHNKHEIAGKRNLKRRLDGSEWEKQFFKCSFKEFKRLHGDIPFDRAVEEAIELRNKTGWRTYDPPTEPAKKLFRTVRKFLPSPVGRSLELYRAIGTRLDQHYHMDGWFTIGSYHHIILVGIDLTVNPNKQQSDCVIVRPHDISHRIESLAQLIARKIQEKLRRVETERSRRHSSRHHN